MVTLTEQERTIRSFLTFGVDKARACKDACHKEQTPAKPTERTERSGRAKLKPVDMEPGVIIETT